MRPAHVGSRQWKVGGLSAVSTGSVVMDFVAFLREDFALQHIELRLVLFRQQEPEEADDDESLQPKRLLRAAIVVVVVVVVATGATSSTLAVLAATVHVGVGLIRRFDLLCVVTDVRNQLVDLFL